MEKIKKVPSNTTSTQQSVSKNTNSTKSKASSAVKKQPQATPQKPVVKSNVQQNANKTNPSKIPQKQSINKNNQSKVQPKQKKVDEAGFIKKNKDNIVNNAIKQNKILISWSLNGKQMNLADIVKTLNSNPDENSQIAFFVYSNNMSFDEISQLGGHENEVVSEASLKDLGGKVKQFFTGTDEGKSIGNNLNKLHRKLNTAIQNPKNINIIKNGDSYKLTLTDTAMPVKSGQKFYPEDISSFIGGSTNQDLEQSQSSNDKQSKSFDTQQSQSSPNSQDLQKKIKSVVGKIEDILKNKKYDNNVPVLKAKLAGNINSIKKIIGA